MVTKSKKPIVVTLMIMTIVKDCEVKVAQSCPTLCDLMDYTVPGILQARILEWIAISFSRGSSQPQDQTQVSCIAGGIITNWAISEASQRILLQKVKSQRREIKKKVNTINQMATEVFT